MKTLAKALVAGCAILTGCSAGPPPIAEPERMAALERTYEDLHKRLEAAAEKDPLVAAAFADRGSVVVAIRASLLEELAGNVAKRYLDNVKVDLENVHAKSSGEVRRKTFLGKVKVGAWSVSVVLGDLVGDLRAGTPKVSLRAPNMIDLEIPVNVQETFGDATLDFGWDSSGLANMVCKDFELNRGIRGRVLPQKHVINGAMRLANSGASLTATPIFPDRKVRLQLDLTPDSWTIIEEALRSQDTSGTCGTFMNPEQGLTFLKGLAAKGVNVKLPESIFRTVRLPASLQQEVTVNRRVLSLKIQGESLRIEAKTLWSSASIQVQVAANALASPAISSR